MRFHPGPWRDPSEYLRDLIRQDQHNQAAARLRALIADGLESGEGRAVTDAVVDEIRDRAFSDDS